MPAPEAGKVADFRQAARAAVENFVGKYRAYFATNNARCGGAKKSLDPMPRVVLVPGLGLYGLGRCAKDARIAADLAEAAIDTITDAEATGRYQALDDANLFDMEYWSLEQAKLGAAAEKPLISQLIKSVGAEVNIIAGTIDEIGGAPYGSLVVAYGADAETSGRAERFFTENGLVTEVLGYVA